MSTRDDPGFRITVEDLKKGTRDAVEVLPGDYVLLALGPCHLYHTQRFDNGTVVLTIKGLPGSHAGGGGDQVTTVDIMADVGETLTYYSAGLCVELSVPNPVECVHKPLLVPVTRGGAFHSVIVLRSYLDLLCSEHEPRIMDWMRLHGLDPNEVAADGIRGYDADSGEWRIKVWRRRDGYLYIDPVTHAPASVIVRRRALASLPWPQVTT